MPDEEEPPITVTTWDDEVDWVGFSTSTRDGAARVNGRLDQVDEHLVLTRLEFTAVDSGGSGVTSSTLRALRLDKVLGQVRGELMRDHARETDAGSGGAARDSAAQAVLADWRARVEEFALAAAQQKASGKRGFGDDFYRLVALEYVTLTQQGRGGRGALERLAAVMADRMGERQPRSRDNVRDWVAEARRRGFLTPGQPGRGGAMPGPRLYEQQEQS